MEKIGAHWHHVDVMDGHFVPNLTFGLPLIKSLKAASTIPLDVHIMITNPDAMALDYVEAGADILSFHIEAAIHSHRLLTAIRAKGRLAGVAINPGTSMALLEPILPYIDVVNVMSVNPGFGGQSFIKETVEKIALLDRMRKSHNLEGKLLIEVDGGINDQTAKLVMDAGADVLVAGNYLYGAKDRAAAMQKLLD